MHKLLLLLKRDKNREREDASPKMVGGRRKRELYFNSGRHFTQESAEMVLRNYFPDQCNFYKRESIIYLYRENK